MFNQFVILTSILNNDSRNRDKLTILKITAELTKLYYSIGEVAEMFDVSTSLIRYWESEFTFLRPKKNRKGDRQFTEKDIRYLEKIYILVKERGFTLDGAKKELKRNRKAPIAQQKKPATTLDKVLLKKKLSRIKSNLETLRNQF